MEEKILEIVKRNFEIRDGLINQAQKDTAEEVVDIFRKFLVYWDGEECVDLYLDEDFDYWWNNIKDK